MTECGGETGDWRERWTGVQAVTVTSWVCPSNTADPSLSTWSTLVDTWQSTLHSSVAREGQVWGGDGGTHVQTTATHHSIINSQLWGAPLI